MSGVSIFLILSLVVSHPPRSCHMSWVFHNMVFSGSTTYYMVHGFQKERSTSSQVHVQNWLIIICCILSVKCHRVHHSGVQWSGEIGTFFFFFFNVRMPRCHCRRLVNLGDRVVNIFEKYSLPLSLWCSGQTCHSTVPHNWILPPIKAIQCLAKRLMISYFN